MLAIFSLITQSEQNSLTQKKTKKNAKIDTLASFACFKKEQDTVVIFC
jgi:uncharacterized protein YaaQ